MKPLIVQAATRTAQAAVDHTIASLGTTVVVEGGPGSGRTLVLQIAADILTQSGRKPVLVSPPERQIDTASVALLDAAVGLAETGSLGHRLIPWRNPATWRERINDVRRWFREANEGGDLVLLVDDTTQWAIPEAPEATRRAEEVIDLLVHEVDCSKILIAANSDVLCDKVIHMEMPSGAELLTDPDASWGLLSEAALKINSAIPEVASKSAAHIAMAVAFAALRSTDELRTWWTARLTTEQVADRVVAVAATDRKFRPLWYAWLVAALARHPVPRTWLTPALRRVVAPQQSAVLEHCLLVGDLTVAVTREARASCWRRGEDRFMAFTRERGSRLLHDAYIGETESAMEAGAASALRLGAEALYLAGRLGDTETSQRVLVPFSEQFNAVGVSALERADWPNAASAFDLALEIDPDDAYARHYLGFSLDNDAFEPRRVESSYTRALDLEPSYATWHARLISFLVVQARMRDASERWENSRAQLLGIDGAGSLDLYAHLHLPVAANILRRAELAMGWRVLDDIPQWAQSQLLAYSDQRHRLEVLERAREIGSYVPAHRASPDWWHQGPELLSDRHPDGRPLNTWVAAGVEAITEDGIDLSVAVVRKTNQPTVGTTTLSWDQWRTFTTDVARAEALRVGDFIEIGYYSVGSEMGTDPVIRVLPVVDWSAGIETPLDPARYLRRAQWSAS